ncbi:MAG TPA: hypothetical protein VKU00_07320, partial [Chthonomonadaceae bacterium]|nr:hypothetical protein [Chthonomonadaceae bacterium]
VSNDPSFTFTFVDTKGIVVVDQADVKTFVAGLYIASALVQFIQAYNYDWGTFPFQSAISDVFPGISVLTPSLYMPPAPFVTLNSGGTARFPIIKTDLSMAMSKALVALDALAARQDNVRHLINASNLDIPTLRNDIKEFQSALTRPTTVTVLGIPTGVVINLNAWFIHPPADLHLFEPTYTLDLLDQAGQGNFIATVSNYPDKTFGGLITGLPDANYYRSAYMSSKVGQLSDLIIRSSSL